jgi:hypothetical protein
VDIVAGHYSACDKLSTRNLLEPLHLLISSSLDGYWHACHLMLFYDHFTVLNGTRSKLMNIGRLSLGISFFLFYQFYICLHVYTLLFSSRVLSGGIRE